MAVTNDKAEKSSPDPKKVCPEVRDICIKFHTNMIRLVLFVHEQNCVMAHITLIFLHESKPIFFF